MDDSHSPRHLAEVYHNTLGNRHIAAARGA